MKTIRMIFFLFAHVATVAALPVGQNNVFIAYETLEMSMNNFQNFAGEAGYRFNDRWQSRLVIMEVNEAESHFASGWQASGVKGGNVTGYFRSYEINADWFFSDHWYTGALIGYTRKKFNYLLGDQKIDHETPILGIQIGYSRQNLFGIPHLFLNFVVPFKYYVGHINEQHWGDTTIRPHIFTNNIWLFIGFNF